jgi:hypothetical protein
MFHSPVNIFIFHSYGKIIGEYKKRYDIFAKIIHINLAVKFNLLKDTQPHYIYKPESCLENDNYKLYFVRTVLTNIHIQHNRPDIIILNNIIHNKVKMRRRDTGNYVDKHCTIT